MKQSRPLRAGTADCGERKASVGVPQSDGRNREAPAALPPEDRPGSRPRGGQVVADGRMEFSSSKARAPAPGRAEAALSIATARPQRSPRGGT
jgi:hypothetical protein